MDEKKSVNTGGGGVVEGDVNTGKFTGRDENDNRRSNRVDPQQTMFNIGSGTNQNADYIQLWMKILELAQQIREVTFQVNQAAGLPDRVRRLEEGLEVVIRSGPEILIRPNSESVRISVHTLISILIGVVVVVIILVAYLVYLQLQNG